MLYFPTLTHTGQLPVTLLRAYCYALLLYALGFAAHELVFPPNTGFPFTTFYPVIILSFFFLGFRAGLLTFVFSAVTAYYAYIPPFFSFESNEPGMLGMVFFTCTNLLIGYLIHTLHLNKHRYQILLEDQTDAISRFTPQGELVYANKAYLRLFGFKQKSQLPQHWQPVVFNEDIEIVEQKIQQISFENPVVIIENRIYDHARTVRWFQFINHGIFNDNKKLIEIQSVGREITEVKKQQDLLKFMAHHDALTGLPNRLLFYDRLKQAILSAKRRNRVVAVCFLDLDGFKQTNDQYGHNAGDEVLMTISQRLLDVVRESDTVSRMGGDEFMLIINDYHHDTDHIRIIQRMLDRISEPILLKNGVKTHVTASVGMSQYPQDSRASEALIQIADQRMYVAKASGRNKVIDMDNNEAMAVNAATTAPN